MSWFRRSSRQRVPTWPYTPDARDRVVPLDDVPQSDIGAPLPTVLASESRLLLIYLLQETPPEWDGTWTTIVSAESTDMPVAVMELERPYAHILGPPNDEAFIGHPLSDRGLHPYGAFVIENSSWIRALKRMNSVHEHHRPEAFGEMRHYVFSFHDSTFECVARGFSVTTHRGSLRDVVAAAAAELA